MTEIQAGLLKVAAIIEIEGYVNCADTVRGAVAALTQSALDIQTLKDENEILRGQVPRWIDSRCFDHRAHGSLLVSHTGVMLVVSKPYPSIPALHAEEDKP